MGNDFEIGDRVIGEDGLTAIVTATYELVTVSWDNDGSTGDGVLWPTSIFEHFAPPRAFEEGMFVRIVGTSFDGRVGYLFEDDGDEEEFDPYSVAVFGEEDEDLQFSASELTLWNPQFAERVLEVDVEDGIVGTVTNTFPLQVLWDGFPHTQYFHAEDLEPAEEWPEFKVGDEVEYNNPLFCSIYNATVTGVEGNILHVDFTAPALGNGAYPADCFTKKVA